MKPMDSVGTCNTWDFVFRGRGGDFTEERSSNCAIEMGKIGGGMSGRSFQAREPSDEGSTEWGAFALCLGLKPAVDHVLKCGRLTVKRIWRQDRTERGI